MSNISGQLIKDSFNYVLQSDLVSGVVFRIGGSVAQNPKFISGLTVNTSFTYSDGSEFPGYVLTCDAAGNAVWGPVSATTSGIFVTGGTFNYTTGTLQLVNSNGSQVTISGLTDTYVTGGTISGTSIVFSYNDTNTFQVTGITPYNVFSSYTASTQVTINNSITGGTYSNGSLNLINNSGGTVTITGFTTGTTDSYVTGFSLNNDTIILSQNRLDQYSSFTVSLSGYVNNIIFSSYTATTQPLILNSVTGGTYSGGTLYLVNNSGGTITITGFSTSSSGGTISGDYLPLSGGTVTGGTIFQSGLTANTISATTYQNLPISGLTAGQNISITGSNGNFTISFTGSTGGSFTGGTVTGPTNFTGGLTANTFSATTYLGLPPDIFVTGATYSNNTFTYTNNTGGTFNVLFNTVTGLTVNGNLTVTGNTSIQGLTANTISATTYQNLPTDIRVTGATYSNNTFTYTNNTGGTFNVLFNTVTGLTVNGNLIVTGITSSETISATTYQNLPISGLTEGQDISITGSNGNFTISFTGSTGGSFTGGTVTGPTIFTNGLSANTISATTYQNLPTDVFVTGGTYSSGTTTITFTNNTGGTFTVTGITSGGGSSSTFTGGTVSGPTDFTNGLTANTISATTYQNLPVTADTFVTGFSLNNETITLSQNRVDQYSAFNISLSGYVTNNIFSSYTASTQSTINNKLDTSGFTAYTASTQPLILNSVTGGTFSGGTLYLINNSGTTIPISGFTTGGTSTTDTFVTGFSLNSNVITLSQNRTDSYSSFTISLSAYTGSSVSGEYLPLSGGTVTGNTTFTSGLTVNYIDFDTTPNVPAPTGGTVYFDSNENALSYKPITPSNDVTVNLGQESLIRIYNNLGFQINNGQALHITGATLGVPTVSLAVGTGGDEVQFQISGIATHDIPDSSFGFMTFFGIVRDINLTGFTVGEQIYLSQTVPGGLASYSDLSFTGRTCEVGHVLDNSVLGKLQVSILNEIEGTIITTQENNILAANNSSTGVFNFSGLSITTPSGTTFNVGPVEGWIIDNVTEPANPTIRLIIYPGSTGNTALYVSSATETYILLTSGLTLTQQTTFPTPQQRRQNLYLGKFGHANRQFLINAFNEPDSSLSPVSQLRDMFTPIRLINGGIYPSANGNSLTFNSSAGVLYGLGIGYITNKLDPNSLSVSGTSPCTFQYRTQTGGTASNTTLITPGVYDNNGVVTSVGGGSNSSTNQRIYLVQNGQFRLQYGQQVYGNLAAAIEASQSEAFTTFSNFRDNAILIGILSVNKNATNLSDITQARFLLTSKFGETVGSAGGISTTNLQQAYNNSATPEIVTNSAEGALSIQNGAGTADNVTNLFEGKGSSAGPLSGTTSFIRADGLISGSSVSTPGFTANTGGLTALTISATTYLNLPKDVFVTGGTYNSGTTTITFTNNTGGTFTVTGITAGSGGSGTSVTGGTFNYDTHTLTLNNSNGTSVDITGLTDTFVTGGTYNGSQITFTNNSGGTFVVSGLTATGFSANYYGSFSNTTDIPVSGANIATVWTYNNTELSNGIVVQNNSQIKVNNTGVYEFGYSPQIEKTQGSDATITIWAAINGIPVIRSSSTLKLVSNSVLTLPFVSFIFEMNANDYVEFFFSSDNQYVQLTSLSGLTTPTRPDSPALIVVAKQVGLSVSAGGTGDTYVTGFSLSDNVITLSQNREDEYSAFTISLSAYTGSSISGDYLPLSGGTVTGSTNFTEGLTATTISATTYYNLPVDVFVTGGTYSSGTTTITFTNNTGGTFTVTGITSGGGGPFTFTGGTVSGATNFTGGLTADTISATTYQNLPVSAVTSGSGISAVTSNGVVTVTNLSPDQTVTITGGTNIQIEGTYPNFGVNFTGTTGGGSFTGGTVSGATNFTGGLSANTISATTISGDTLFGNGANLTGIPRTGQITSIFDGLGGVVQTGIGRNYITIPYTGTLTGWTIFSSVVGTIDIDFYDDNYANFPPTSADTIFTSINRPKLTNTNKNQATGLNIPLTSGDILIPEVLSVTGCTNVVVNLQIIRTT